MRDDIQLGDLAEDMITGYKGIVVGITKHITGCDRFILQSQETKDGKIADAYNFDVSTCKLIRSGVVKPLDKTPEKIKTEIKPGGPPTKALRY